MAYDAYTIDDLLERLQRYSQRGHGKAEVRLAHGEAPLSAGPCRSLSLFRDEDSGDATLVLSAPEEVT